MGCTSGSSAGIVLKTSPSIVSVTPPKTFTMTVNSGESTEAFWQHSKRDSMLLVDLVNSLCFSDRYMKMLDASFGARYDSERGGYDYSID